jgi:hypothetical protein
MLLAVNSPAVREAAKELAKHANAREQLTGKPANTMRFHCPSPIQSESAHTTHRAARTNTLFDY